MFYMIIKYKQKKSYCKIIAKKVININKRDKKLNVIANKTQML